MWLYFEEYQYTDTCHLCSQPFHRNISFLLQYFQRSGGNGQIYTFLCWFHFQEMFWVDFHPHCVVQRRWNGPDIGWLQPREIVKMGSNLVKGQPADFLSHLILNQLIECIHLFFLEFEKNFRKFQPYHAIFSLYNNYPNRISTVYGEYHILLQWIGRFS